MKLTLVSLLAIFSLTIQAKTTVAIIDSGVDIKHKDIEPQVWHNPGETPNNRRDEDNNGYQDDVFGWNFAEDNNQVIDYSYLGTLNDDIRKFFAIQGRSLRGNASDEDRAWVAQMREDEEFMKKLQVYGNFMHGTHVTGIALEGNTASDVLSVKLIPTEVKLPFYLIPGAHEEAGMKNNKNWRMKIIQKAIEALASQQSLTMQEIGTYVGSHGSDIANGSFGTGSTQAFMISQALHKLTFNKEPTQEEIEEVAKMFLKEMVKASATLVTSAPNTLFVFAAGNDGTNNDEYPTSPASIKEPNVISVAATLERNQLAVFSNFGAKNVDVAAPGVTINSAVPGDNYLEVSGTSQAAPFVAGVAAQIKEANPSLSPKDIRTILMGTVDKKDFLSVAVTSGGIVNMKRAVVAGELSKTMSVSDSVRRARSRVKDVEVKSSFPEVTTGKDMVLPLPGLFSL